MTSSSPPLTKHTGLAQMIRIVLRVAKALSRAVLAIVAAVLATFVSLIIVGAYFPSIPKLGIIGPVIAGQWPLHLMMIIGAALAVSATLWRFGPSRSGRAFTAASAASAIALAAIMAQQVVYAERQGTSLSWDEVFTEMAYPATAPDDTITYAVVDGEPLQVDAYLPSPRPAKPTSAIVLAHGGGFHAVDFTKTDLRGTARWLADHGIATFTIDYRLATSTSPTWDEAPQDVVCALAWVNHHASEFNIDSSAISIGGMSAGGALALTAAYRLNDHTIESSCGPTPPPPASVVAFYPAVIWGATLSERRTPRACLRSARSGSAPNIRTS